MSLQYTEVLGQKVRRWDPYCIQIEPVEGCNRRCWFCGLLTLPGDRQEGVNFVKPELLTKVFTELNDWLPKIRVEINLHGEPTMHPQFMECLLAMRQAMPSCCLILQTNTDLWKDEARTYISRLFRSGLTTLVLNAYHPGRYDWWKDELSRLQLPYVDYYWDNPKQAAYNLYVPPHKQRIFLLDDLGKINSNEPGAVSQHPNKRLHNSAGSSIERVIEKKTGRKFKTMPLSNKCSKVFREIVMGYDGKVSVCCLDWHDVSVIGDANTTNIRDIWNSERYWAIRQLLFRKRRDLLLPCNTCSDPTVRTGLLKDPMLVQTDNELLDIIRSSGPTSGRGVQSPITLDWAGPFPPKG